MFHKMKLFIRDKLTEALTYNLEIERGKDIMNIKNGKDAAYLKDAKTQEVIYRGDSYEIMNYLKGNPSGVNGFWSSLNDDQVAYHDPVVGNVIDYYSRVISSSFKGYSVEDNEDIKEIIDLILSKENEQDIGSIIKEAIKNTLIYGEVCIKIEDGQPLTNVPLVSIVEGTKVEYEIIRGRVNAIYFKEIYNEKGKDYLLVEERRKGLIKYTLYDRNNKKVSLDNVEELKDLPDEPIEHDGGFLAFQFKVNNHPIDKHRGKPLFSDRVDTIQYLDEISSKLLATARKSEPIRLMDERVVSKKFKYSDNTNGINSIKEVSVKKPVDGQDILVYQSDKGARDKMPELIKTAQIDINSEGYVLAEQSARKKLLEGIISPESLGIDNGSYIDNAAAQKDREKITIEVVNDLIANTEVMLEQLFLNIIEFLQNMNIDEEIRKVDLDDLKIDLRFEEFGGETFKERVEVARILKPVGDILSDASILRYINPEVEDEEIDEELNRLRQQNIPDGSFSDLPTLYDRYSDDYFKRETDGIND